MRVTVLTGGATAERVVAFAGAAQVVAALRERQHEVRVVDTVSGLLTAEDERRLLTGEVGRSLPNLEDLDERERRFLSERIATLPAVTGAEVLFLCVHGGRG
ncbi:MAG: D-alanine--D-alanine ligase, partial [Gemmatimonadetes bacterium]